MAIGGVISNGNFGSFLGSGKAYQTEQVTHQRGEHLVVSVAGYAGGNSFIKKSPILRECCSYMPRNSYYPVLHLIGPSDKKTAMQMARVFAEVEHPLSNSLCIFEKFHIMNLKRRIQGRCECFLSSDPSLSSWVQPRKLVKLGITDGQYQQSEYRKAVRTCADCKSEQYDQTGQVPNEVFLVGGNVKKISSWWEQFPKRWVIVLLCCSAFLLCNMDRVNMSIAILPMSQEFNWNSATVGLIQSSFFWGYLLTQVWLGYRSSNHNMYNTALLYVKRKTKKVR